MSYAHVSQSLQSQPRTWLVTGAAGFIGSNLIEALLRLDQTVVGLDNFSTGHHANLADVRQSVSADQWGRFRLVEGDITDLDTCLQSMRGVDVVLHQAALGSVPRSIENPLATNAANIDGFLTMLVAACKSNVKRFVYAASSSTYGDHPDLPKQEDRIGKPLSPYAVTKYVNELYADVFARTYGLETIGLRYFNVFGPRQDPKGAYAAVIPLWFDQLMNDQACHINGDGETSRDFCFVDNAVQANILAAVTENSEAVNQVYNVAFGARTTLNQLFFHIRDLVAAEHPLAQSAEPVYRNFREGDVRHSQADIGRAEALLGYQPSHSPLAGLSETSRWYLQRHKQKQAAIADE